MLKQVLFILLTLTTFNAFSQSEEQADIQKISAEISRIANIHTKKLAQEMAKIKQKVENKLISQDDASREIEFLNLKLNDELEQKINAKMDLLQAEIEKLTAVSIEEVESQMNIPVPLESSEDGNFNENANDESDNNDENTDNENENDDQNEDDDNDLDYDFDIDRMWKGRHDRSEQRTTSQFVFAVGLNNLVTKGELSTFNNKNIKFSTSRFYEWGLTAKTRLIKNSPFLHLKYGVSLLYSNLRPTDNQHFVRISPTSSFPTKGQTILEPYEVNLKHEPYFRTVHWTIPIHMEFDFSKKNREGDNIRFSSQRGLRIGVGGYLGLLSGSKQILEAKTDFGQEKKEIIRNKYGVNEFVYGFSGYIGYKDVSLYAKLDLNPIFTINPIEQNNASIGIRFDLH
jgi:hypothetical protein